MEKEMIINTPCTICSSSQCEVIVDKGGWMSIVCVECGQEVASGFASSPWELLRQVNGMSDKG